MGFFFGKKKTKKEEPLGPLPEFPKLPDEHHFPSYESEIDKEDDLPEIAPPPIFPKKEKEHHQIHKKEEHIHHIHKKPKEEHQKEMEMPHKLAEPVHKPKPTGEKPIYVKIEKYKTAVSTLEEIQNKLGEAEKVLKELNRLKNEEDGEIQKWQEDISDIKEKLESVDQALFEV
jgi:hypothetical protein